MSYKELTLEEIQNSKYLNNDTKSVFTAKDMVEAISFGNDIQFTSTSDYYTQVEGYIQATAEMREEQPYFLNEKDINLFEDGLEMILPYSTEERQEQISNLLNKLYNVKRNKESNS